jgi:hypothetical protein
MESKKKFLNILAGVFLFLALGCAVGYLVFSLVSNLNYPSPAIVSIYLFSISFILLILVSSFSVSHHDSLFSSIIMVLGFCFCVSLIFVIMYFMRSVKAEDYALKTPFVTMLLVWLVPLTGSLVFSVLSFFKIKMPRFLTFSFSVLDLLVLISLLVLACYSPFKELAILLGSIFFFKAEESLSLRFD